MTRKPQGNNETKLDWAKHLKPDGKREGAKKQRQDGKLGIRFLLSGNWYKASGHMSL